jgi:hypothetical protein
VLDLAVDVTGRCEVDGAQHLAASVFLPDPSDLPARPIVFFALPGGGYGRQYYDIRKPGLPGYSQAGYHVGRGAVFVSIDHLGVGDSSQPDPDGLRFEHLAAAAHAAATEIMAMVREGRISPGYPAIPEFVTVGIGQSMGGCMTVVQQGLHRTYDAIGVLGFSAIHTAYPDRESAGTVPLPVPSRGASIRAEELEFVPFTEAQIRYAFHYDDVPAAFAEPDLAAYMAPSRGDSQTPWGSATCPTCAMTMMSEGAISQEAAAIDVPVFLATGERDVSPTRAPNRRPMCAARTCRCWSSRACRTCTTSRAHERSSGLACRPGRTELPGAQHVRAYRYDPFLRSVGHPHRGGSGLGRWLVDCYLRGDASVTVLGAIARQRPAPSRLREHCDAAARSG